MILRAFDGEWRPFYPTLERVIDQMLDITTGIKRNKLYDDLIDITDHLIDSNNLQTKVIHHISHARSHRVAPAVDLADDLRRTLALLDGRISAGLHNSLVNELTIVELNIQEGVQV